MSAFDRLLWILAGALLYFFGSFLFKLLRAIFCGCWKHHANAGQLELPRHWDVSCWYWSCSHCGKRYVDWELFCKLLKAEEEEGL